MDDVEAPEVEVEVEATEVEVAPEPEYTSVADDGSYSFGDDQDPISGADLKSGWLKNDDYTRKTQSLAEARKGFESEQETWKKDAGNYQQQVQKHYQDLYLQQVQNAQGGQQKPADPLDSVWKQAEANGGIMTVAEAKSLVQHFQGGNEQSAQQSQQMLNALGMLNDRINGIETPFNELVQSRSSAQLERQLDQFLDAKNVPKGATRDSMREVLWGFEPTDAEKKAGQDHFDAWGTVFDTFSNGASEVTKAQAESAHKNLGRRGGNASPSNPAKGPMTIEDIVDATWKE